MHVGRGLCNVPECWRAEGALVGFGLRLLVAAEVFEFTLRVSRPTPRLWNLPSVNRAYFSSIVWHTTQLPLFLFSKTG